MEEKNDTRALMDSLKESLKNEISGNVFFGILNPEVLKIKKKIKEIQEQCTHEFVDGKCVYCDKKEDI